MEGDDGGVTANGAQRDSIEAYLNFFSHFVSYLIPVFAATDIGRRTIPPDHPLFPAATAHCLRPESLGCQVATSCSGDPGLCRKGKMR